MYSGHHTLHMLQAINLTRVNCRMLENLGSNVQHLVIQYCSILDNNWNKKLFLNVEFLKIDSTTLCHPKSLCFASNKLKRLHVDICERSSAMNALNLLKSVSETIVELNLKCIQIPAY